MSRSRSPATSARRSPRWSATVDPNATIVCEASSFQLEDTDHFAPECAVFLNLAPDHLDRHADLDSYLAAKLRIFANQGNDDVAIYNADDPALAGTDLGGCGRRIAFCHGAGPDCEVALAEGTIFYDGEPLLRAEELGLLGEHNVANAMAAAAAALAMGLDREAVREGLRSFAGVPHRLEPVAEIDGVRFVNDSKATNVASAVVGLRAFDGGVHAILGGSDKGEPFAPLARAAASTLRRLLPDRRDRRPARGRAGAGVVEAGVPLHRCADLDDAVRTRRRRGAPRGGRPALARLRQLRRLRELRAARRSLPRDRRGARVSARALALRWPGRTAAARKKRKKKRARAASLPTEYNMLLTATLCLLAFGAVMVFSASSTTRVLSDGGLSDSAYLPEADR